MAKSTGPMLAVGAITLANRSLLNAKPIDWKIPIGTAIAAGGLALIERASPNIAVGLAWIALVTVLFVRVDRTVPPPAESLLKLLG